MFALQDYIDAQFGGPGKGFFRIVTSSGAGPAGDQRRQARGGARSRGVRGARLRAHRRHAALHDRADRPAARRAPRRSACGRCSRCTSSTTRSAAPPSTTAPPACSSTPATSTPPASGGSRSRARPAPRPTTPPPTCPATRTCSTRCSAKASLPLLAGRPAGLSHRPALQPAGPHRARHPPHRGDGGARDDRRDRPHEREGPHEALTDARAPRLLRADHQPQLGRRHASSALQNLGGVVAPYAAPPRPTSSRWQAARANRPASFFFGVGYGSDTNGLGAQAGPRPGAAHNPVTYPYRTFDGGTVMQQSRSGSRALGRQHRRRRQLRPVPRLRRGPAPHRGPQIVADMANGAEAYLQMWARAEAFAAG